MLVVWILSAHLPAPDGNLTDVFKAWTASHASAYNDLFERMRTESGFER